MRVVIAQRYRPFCHLPGTRCLLPGSPYRLTIYPTLVELHDLTDRPAPITELSLPLKGPFKDFTVVQDLEKGQVRVWGVGPKGLMRYRIVATEGGGALLKWEKGGDGEKVLVGGGGALFSPPPVERLSLGCHKAQDWELMRRRQDLSELLPFWFHLGQLVGRGHFASGGTADLLKRCDKKEIEGFSNLLLAGFEGILSPRLEDRDYLGIATPTPANGSPLHLLSEGYSQIRHLFLHEREEQLFINPPRPFVFGRMVGIKWRLGTLDLEWTKGKIRRLILQIERAGELRLMLPKPLSRHRMRMRSAERGVTINHPQTLLLEAGNRYLLDRFEK